MKKIPLLVLSLSLVLASCATVQQNIDARAYLAKCKYEYAGLKVTGVTFASGILIDAVDLQVAVKITDTSDKDVALDHAEFSFFLDKNLVLDVAHKQFVRIAPKASATEPIDVRVPFGSIVKTLGHRPEKIGVKAKLWVTLLVGKDTWQTPLVIPVEVEVPIPYDQIDAFVAQKKKQLEDEALAQAQAAAAKVQADAQAAADATKKVGEAEAAQKAEAARVEASKAAEAAAQTAEAAKKNLPSVNVPHL
jgi:hypothetical protein